MSVLISAIRILSYFITLAVLADIVLSFFMDPFHPIRRTLDRLVEPMLAPIRSVIPPVAGIDFSPMVLLVLVQVVEQILIRVLISLS